MRAQDIMLPAGSDTQDRALVIAAVMAALFVSAISQKIGRAHV